MGLLSFEVDTDLSFLSLCGSDRGIGKDFNTLLGKRLLERHADFGIFDGQNVGEHFDERYLGSECVKEVGELYSDGAGADDDQFLRLRIDDHRVMAVHNGFAIDR